MAESRKGSNVGAEKPRKAARAKAPARRAGTVALVGRPNVGKSTLLNALLGERLAITSAKPQTTRDRIAGILTKENEQFVFLDTPGVHAAKNKLGTRMNQLAEEAARDADVVVFLVELTSPPKATLSREDLAVLSKVPADKKVLLVLNKVDRVKKKEELFPVLEAYAKVRDFAAIVPLSARKVDGGERVLAELGPLLPEGDFLYPEDEISDKPVRFFVAEYVREQLLKLTHDEVPHGVAVEVESFDEGLRVPRIQVVVHVDKDSHKGIVLGEKGRLMKEVGSGARARVEALLGRQVHLAVHVRTTPGWYESDAKLNELGYAKTSGTRREDKR
jgi:GTP-binding protein Era